MTVWTKSVWKALAAVVMAAALAGCALQSGEVPAQAPLASGGGVLASTQAEEPGENSQTDASEGSSSQSP